MRHFSGAGFAVAALLSQPAAAMDLDLDRIAATQVKDGLSITVDVGDDVPTAVSVIARFQNNQPLMLGRDGLWAPWNGDLQKLDDVGATPDKGKLTLRVFDHLPKDLFFPVSFTVAYRTAEGLKSGTLVVDGP